jgi:hypothetical protein
VRPLLCRLTLMLAAAFPAAGQTFGTAPPVDLGAIAVGSTSSIKTLTIAVDPTATATR